MMVNEDPAAADEPDSWSAGVVRVFGLGLGRGGMRLCYGRDAVEASKSFTRVREQARLISRFITQL
jgi:hypothetical protein